MAKSSDVGAVRVPRKLELSEMLTLDIMGSVDPVVARHVGQCAHDRLAYLESLVQDVAKHVHPVESINTRGRIDLDNRVCTMCGGEWRDEFGAEHRTDCPYPRLLAAVADDREEK